MKPEHKKGFGIILISVRSSRLEDVQPAMSRVNEALREV